MAEKQAVETKKEQPKKPITEEQARILLEQAKIESEQNMRSSAGKWKRFLVVGILIALVIVAVGIVEPMLIRGMGE